MTAYLRRTGFEVLRTRLRGGSSARQLRLPSGSCACRRASGRGERRDDAAGSALRAERAARHALTMLVLGLVPARGGSKGVPGKNVRPLAGRTLLEYAARAARESGVIDRLVLSTDSQEIADAGRRAGIEVPLHASGVACRRRHADGAGHRSTRSASSPARGGRRTSSCCCSRRRRCDVPNTFAMRSTRCATSDADSVVTVVEVPRHLSPDYVMRIDDRPAAAVSSRRRADHAAPGCAACLLARRHRVRLPAGDARALRRASTETTAGRCSSTRPTR